jgi:hypothetical protein
VPPISYFCLPPLLAAFSHFVFIFHFPDFRLFHAIIAYLPAVIFAITLLNIDDY